MNYATGLSVGMAIGNGHSSLIITPYSAYFLIILVSFSLLLAFYVDFEYYIKSKISDYKHSRKLKKEKELSKKLIKDSNELL